MPARVVEDPLAVEFVFSDASRFALPLSYLPCPGLVAELAGGLAALAHPNGGINSPSTGGTIAPRWGSWPVSWRVWVSLGALRN
jgi:hypothetical protein